ncbi:MAG: hypothetical protein LBG91_01990 [Treponema sp.]|jgi:hypothetical protein|nr:hypothetical protein [Treponema sp.]
MTVHLSEAEYQAFMNAIDAEPEKRGIINEKESYTIQRGQHALVICDVVKAGDNCGITIEFTPAFIFGKGKKE